MSFYRAVYVPKRDFSFIFCLTTPCGISAPSRYSRGVSFEINRTARLRVLFSHCVSICRILFNFKFKNVNFPLRPRDIFEKIHNEILKRSPASNFHFLSPTNLSNKITWIIRHIECNFIESVKSRKMYSLFAASWLIFRRAIFHNWNFPQSRIKSINTVGMINSFRLLRGFLVYIQRPRA